MSSYHVTPHPDGGWQVKKANGQRASARADTQADAFDQARRMAKNNAPSQVLTHGRDGRIRDERTYGSDPYPPEG